MKKLSIFFFYNLAIVLLLFSACSFRESTNDSAPQDMDVIKEEFSEELADSAVNQDRAELALGDKIIQSASLTYETTHFQEATTFIDEQLADFDAVLENSSKGQSSSSYGFTGEYISMMIRLPNESLQPFIHELNNFKDLYLQNEEISRVDVTKEFRDNETRLAVLQEEEEALRKLLQEQGTLEEVLQIRTRLSEVIAEREIYENENKYYEDQVEFSTIYLYVQEADRANPQNLGNFGERLTAAFVDSFYRFIAVAQNLLISFIYFIPYLMITTGIAILVYYTQKRIRQKENQ